MKPIFVFSHESNLNRPFKTNDIVMFNDEKYYIDKIYEEFGKPSGLISITSLKYSNIRLRLHHSCVSKTDSVYLKGFLVDGIDELKGEL